MAVTHSRVGGILAVQAQQRDAHSRLSRPALVQELNRALDAGSLLLVAGAGYGKTMALEEALEARAARAVWLRCTRADSDPGRLLRRVVEALREAAPGVVDVFAERLGAAQEQLDVEAAAAELVGELERLLVDPVVVVIDDAEHLHDAPEAAGVVGAVFGA